MQRLTQDIDDLEKVSELGVLFLLFEMGLELSLERLQVWYAWRESVTAAIMCRPACSPRCLGVVRMPTTTTNNC
eukprot:362156-Chlamydomonas_euryale.AAC.6